MIRVCFLLGGFQGNGGIGRVTSVLVNQLCQDSDFEIHTISYFQDQRPLLYEIKPEVHTHVLYTTHCSMTRAMVFRHAIRKVRTILKREEIDFFVVCGALYYPLAIMACKRTKAKCICWEHTNPAISADYKFQNFCRRYAVGKCAHIVVLTRSAEQYYQQHFSVCKNKIIRIYNPIAKEVDRSKHYNIDSRKIISVGRLSYPKNFERLISIAARILPQYPDWSWDIYGNGELKDSLQSLIDKNQLGVQLTLKGQVTDLYDRYSEYAFMVMTSRYEGFPMSLIEGAANRLPLVSFDISTGPNEIITDGENGYLVNPASDEDMVERIRNLIENPTMRSAMSEEVYRTKDAFAIERILEQWNSLFKELT